jgi:hypothetical protein
VLASRNLKWVAPEDFGRAQGEIIAKLPSYEVSHLEVVYRGLQDGELKLMPMRHCSMGQASTGCFAVS